MIAPLINNYRHWSFLRVTFLLVVLLLAVSTVSLPHGVSATSLSERERYGREEKVGFLEGRWKVLIGLQKRGLGMKKNLKRQKSHARSEPFQEVSGNHPTGHSASRGTVALVVGLITLTVAGFMV